MPLLELNLDHFSSIVHNLNISGIDPVIVAGIAEIAGVDSLSLASLEGETEVPRRVLETVSTRFNWRIPVTEKAIDGVMTHPPDIVTFIDPLKTNTCLDLRSEPDLERIFNQVRPIKSVAISVRIEADLKQAKLAYKLGADYVEIDTLPYAQAESQQTRMQALDSLSAVARIAGKYDMGVIASGGMDYRNFRDIADLGTIETITVGRAVLGKAMYIGLENALRDFIFLLK